MTAAKRISSFSDFCQKIAKTKENYSPHKNFTMQPGNISDSNQNQHDFLTSSLQLLRAKYGRHEFNKEHDEVYLAGAYKVLHFMHDAWINGHFCDVYFHVNGEDIPAHKIAIAAYSKALADQFCRYPSGEIIVIEMDDFPREAVLTILNFIYTTDIEIYDGTVESLLACSLELDMEMLIRLCRDHLEKFNESNALDFYSVAEKHSLKALQMKIQNFICAHFIDIVNSETFGRVSFEKLFRVMSFDVHIKTELDAFLTIIRWIDHDRNARLALAPRLLKCVNFRAMTPEILVTEVEVYSHLFEERSCYDMLYDAMKFHAIRLSGSKLLSLYKQNEPMRTPFGTPLKTMPLKDQRQSPGDQTGNTKRANQTFNTPSQSSPRKMGYVCTSTPFPAPPVSINKSFNPQFTSSYENISSSQLFVPGSTLLAIGGINLNSEDLNTPGKCVYQFYPELNSWVLMSTLASPTHHHAAAILAGKLCVLGGCDGDKTKESELGAATNKLMIYDSELATWFPSASMNHCRAYAGAGAHHNAIYVVGGEDEMRRKTDTIEKFDGHYNRWVYVARMRNGAKLGMAVTVYQDHLYIVGGYNKDAPNGPVLPDVECFDLNMQKWVERKPLQSARCHANLVAAGGKLYLIGGRMRCKDSGTMYSVGSVLQYDELGDIWHHVADMQMPRHDAGCAAIGKKIFVVGGMTSPGLDCLDSVECLDASTNTWMTGIASLPSPAAGLACIRL